MQCNTNTQMRPEAILSAWVLEDKWGVFGKTGWGRPEQKITLCVMIAIWPLASLWPDIASQMLGNLLQNVSQTADEWAQIARK